MHDTEQKTADDATSQFVIYYYNIITPKGNASTKWHTQTHIGHFKLYSKHTNT